MISTAFLLVASMVVGQAEQTQSTREDFQEFAGLVVGRWVGDITLVYDWPGQMKKKGDKLTSYETFKWIADEGGIEWESFGGSTTGKTLLVWDAPSRQIKAFHVGSGGGTWQTVVWKETATKWGWKMTGGGLPDGRASTGAGYWTFTDDSKTMHIKGDLKVGDEAVPPFDDVYHKVTE